MSEPTHSPLPWSIDPDKDFRIRDSEDDFVLDATSKQDAEFIVRSANSFHELRESLGIALRQWESYSDEKRACEDSEEEPNKWLAKSDDQESRIFKSCQQALSKSDEH